MQHLLKQFIQSQGKHGWLYKCYFQQFTCEHLKSVLLPTTDNVTVLWINSLIFCKVLFSNLWHLVQKNPKEARELSHRCQHQQVAKIKGSDFKELGKTCHNIIKRMDFADIGGRKGQKLINEVNFCWMFSKFPHSSATIQTQRCVPLFCAYDPKFILSPATSPSQQRCHSNLPFGKLEEKDFCN